MQRMLSCLIAVSASVTLAAAEPAMANGVIVGGGKTCKTAAGVSWLDWNLPTAQSDALKVCEFFYPKTNCLSTTVKDLGYSNPCLGYPPFIPQPRLRSLSSVLRDSVLACVATARGGEAPRAVPGRMLAL